MPTEPHVNRRQFVATFAAAMAAGAASVPAGAAPIAPVPPEVRREQAYDIRHEAALPYRSRPLPAQVTNGDEERYPTRIGNFSKGLPHNAHGEVIPQAYDALLVALATGDPHDLEAVPLGGTVTMVNPAAMLGFVLVGADAPQFALAAPPAFASEAQAAEMAELYWQALARDVPFARYGQEPLTQAAPQDLSAFTPFAGLQVGSLFRGLTRGDATGPYLSQFLVQPIPFGSHVIAQAYRTTVPGDDYGTAYADWLALQNGTPATVTNEEDPWPRYLRNGRDLATFVHGCQSGCPPAMGLATSAFDGGFLAGFTAALILLGYGPDALDPHQPYRSFITHAPFITFGALHALDLVMRVVDPALKAAWYQKWLVHRRLRPEAFAGHVHVYQRGGATYPIHAALLRSDALRAVEEAHGTILLPLAYPEGSPAHPAYPSGHATAVGASVTVLKAFFHEDFVIPQAWVPTDDGGTLEPFPYPLTVGGELDKLASNVAMGRNFGGVHWRSDAAQGLRLGEAVALSVLTDLRGTYPEAFRGFSLTTFDGRPVTI